MDEADPSRRVVRDAWHVLYAVHVHGLVDADDMRDDVRDEREVVGDEQDGDMVVEFAKKTEERFGVLLVQIGGRFVQKEQLRFGGEGLRDEHALPLAAGKLCEGVSCEILHADVMETLHRDVAVVFPVAAEKMAFDTSHEDDVERGRWEVRIV